MEKKDEQLISFCELRAPIQTALGRWETTQANIVTDNAEMQFTPIQLRWSRKIDPLLWKIDR
jgi:hypothetical protein